LHIRIASTLSWNRSVHAAQRSVQTPSSSVSYPIGNTGIRCGPHELSQAPSAGALERRRRQNRASQLASRERNKESNGRFATRALGMRQVQWVNISCDSRSFGANEISENRDWGCPDLPASEGKSRVEEECGVSSSSVMYWSAMGGNVCMLKKTRG